MTRLFLRASGLLLLAGCLAVPIAAVAQSGAGVMRRAAAPDPVAPIGISIRADGLVGTWFPPASGRRSPAILVLGGSEGGEESSKHIATALATKGYGVLALAYFRADGLPKAFQEIPLDYFERAIAWLVAQPLADRRHLGLYGISKGAEVALLVASRHPEFTAVVAAVPSSVIWQGFDPADYRVVKSGFTDHGVPLPYVPYDNSAAFSGILDLYQRSLAHADHHPDAIIPVERIGGALLLLSARDDKLWPSTLMADQIMARLDAHHFVPVHQHIAYADAGHGSVGPGGDRAPNGPYENVGGTIAGNAAAHADAWPQTIAFFDRNLGRPAQ
ncbi:acyl-CoA thioester hydrolase/BAAT C-terminal domain-containing protein [Sphingomonas sp. 28-63-12]|uniref:acyl-CoA thioester hydrolase/BAAT C-terminal domain-containing protein n=1 Tax=Sphingomonas sp. 28-63-12 TaxID=1970434 RepID=UPI000BDAC0E6|nr:MAG: hypothetical protein B7Y47_07300 [Sphingomonas sp. 28-63-12]